MPITTGPERALPSPPAGSDATPSGFVGPAAAAICFLVFGLAPVFLVLLLAVVAGAVTDAGVIGPSYAVAGTAFTGTAARRAIGWTQAAQAGSAIVGVPLLAALGATAGWRAAFVAAGLAALAGMVLAATWLPRDHRRSAEPLRVEALLEPYRPLLRHSGMRRLYGATIAGAGLIALAFSGWIGTVGAVVAVAGAALMWGVEGVAMTAVLTAETPSGAGTTMTLSGSLFNLGGGRRSHRRSPPRLVRV